MNHKTVTIATSMKKIVVAEVFRLMLDQVKDGRIRLTLGGLPKTSSKGGLVYLHELTDHFLKFCKYKDVKPTHPLKPWDFDYIGSDEQILSYEISVDDFREFAHGYGFEILCVDRVEQRGLPDPVEYEEEEEPEFEFGDELLDSAPKLDAKSKRVSDNFGWQPARKRSGYEEVEGAVVGSIVPGPGITFLNRDMSSSHDPDDWGEDDPGLGGLQKSTSNSSEILPRRDVDLRNGSRGADNQFLKNRVPLRQTGPDLRESVVEQTISAAPPPADHDQKLAGLFDPVTVAQLEKMFPTQGKDEHGKWRGWADRAARNGLKTAARDGRATFNPYRAAIWWLKNGPEGWDLARCHRALANNLPARSMDFKHLLTGN